jgi:hypothetical protein
VRCAFAGRGRLCDLRPLTRVCKTLDLHVTTFHDCIRERYISQVKAAFGVPWSQLALSFFQPCVMCACLLRQAIPSDSALSPPKDLDCRLHAPVFRNCTIPDAGLAIPTRHLAAGSGPSPLTHLTAIRHKSRQSTIACNSAGRQTLLSSLPPPYISSCSGSHWLFPPSQSSHDTGLAPSPHLHHPTTIASDTSLLLSQRTIAIIAE